MGAGRSCDGDPDEHEMCLAWHKAGYCRTPRAAIDAAGRQVNVREACKRTCGMCRAVKGRNPPVARVDRCRRDNHSAAVPAGMLDSLFERIIAEHPEYEPRALSTSPYVLHLRLRGIALSGTDKDDNAETCM